MRGGKEVKLKLAAAAARLKKATTKAQTPSTAKAKSPRSQPLPGMEQVTNRVLNNACETIADGRSQMAVGRTLEQEGMGIALQEMQRRGVRSYRHGGVELAFVPGVDKLRVRLTEDATHATGEGLEMAVDDAGNPEPADVGDVDGLEVDGVTH